MAEFTDLSLEEQIAYARQKVQYWRDVERGLLRIQDALTDGERDALRVQVVEKQAEVSSLTPDTMAGKVALREQAQPV